MRSLLTVIALGSSLALGASSKLKSADNMVKDVVDTIKHPNTIYFDASSAKGDADQQFSMCKKLFEKHNISTSACDGKGELHVRKSVCSTTFGPARLFSPQLRVGISW